MKNLERLKKRKAKKDKRASQTQLQTEADSRKPSFAAALPATRQASGRLKVLWGEILNIIKLLGAALPLWSRRRAANFVT
ncbi:hypothetical protein Pfo_015044 [Paulownia fortunei]|nr:hypothetical protein Pfo_015044 [Paulownia fortunei]